MKRRRGKERERRRERKRERGQGRGERRKRKTQKKREREGGGEEIDRREYEGSSIIPHLTSEHHLHKLFNRSADGGGARYDHLDTPTNQVLYLLEDYLVPNGIPPHHASRKNAHNYIDTRTTGNR